MLQYQTIALLDDDISIEAWQSAAATCSLSVDCPMAGFSIHDFPDVSTTEHLNRLITGEPSLTMPGGNSLFLLVSEVTGYFPYCYNEDWLFILFNLQNRRGSLVGQVTQDPHEPWTDHLRIAFEEFGELLLYGLFPYRKDLSAPELTNDEYWRDVMVSRRTGHLALLDHPNGGGFAPSIQAALRTLDAVAPDSCTRFLSTLQTDMRTNLWIPNLPNVE